MVSKSSHKVNGKSKGKDSVCDLLSVLKTETGNKLFVLI